MRMIVIKNVENVFHKLVKLLKLKGKVVSLDVINKKYTVLIPEKGEIEVSVLDGSR